MKKKLFQLVLWGLLILFSINLFAQEAGSQRSISLTPTFGGTRIGFGILQDAPGISWYTYSTFRYSGENESIRLYGGNNPNFFSFQITEYFNVREFAHQQQLRFYKSLNNSDFHPFFLMGGGFRIIDFKSVSSEPDFTFPPSPLPSILEEKEAWAMRGSFDLGFGLDFDLLPIGVFGGVNGGLAFTRSKGSGKTIRTNNNFYPAFSPYSGGTKVFILFEIGYRWNK